MMLSKKSSRSKFEPTAQPENPPAPQKTPKKRSRKTRLGYSIICFILVVAVAGVSVAFTNQNTAYTTISVVFSEIAQGCNPDGSPFDIYEVLTDEVLQRTCEKLDNRVDPETLRKHLSVTGITTDGSFNAILNNVLDGNDTYSYFPSKYTISYSIISDAIKAEGKKAELDAFLDQFNMPSTDLILSSVAESYKEYYIDRYIVTSSVFDVDWQDVKTLDHFNRAAEMNNILTRISRYLETRYNRNTKYVSQSGYSFGDLQAEAARLMANDIKEYQSYIIQNGITGDKDKLMKQFRYVAKENREQAERSRGEYNIMLDGISIYDPLVTKVVFIPALDADRVFYMNRTKTGIDYLTEKASSANLAGDEYENTADYYDYLINQFAGFEDSEEWVLKAADDRYDAICQKIDTFLASAAAVNDEYIDTVAYETVSVSGIGHGQGLVSSGVEFAKIAVIFTSVLYLWWLVYSQIKKRKSKKGGKHHVVA